MAKPMYGQEEIVAELRRRVQLCGMAKTIADELKISRPYLSMVLHGKRRPSTRLAKALGFRRVIRWERAE